MDGYRTAAVCLNGHTESSGVEDHAEAIGNYCPDCGASIITKCPQCAKGIRGYYHVSGVFSISDCYEPPSFCFNCGSQFPWTEKRLATMNEMVDELDSLSEEEKDKLKNAVVDVANDGTTTELSALRIKKLLAKAGGELGRALWRTTIEVASEAAKKVLQSGQLPF